MLEILLNNSRSFGGFEDITSSADLDVWTRIASTYSHIERRHPKRGRYTIDIDWGSRLQYERKYNQVFGLPNPDLRSIVGTFEFEHVHVCPAAVTFETQEAPRSNNGMHELNVLLLDLYLLANIACPGALNLHRSFIRDTTLDPSKDVLAQTELEMSEYVFEIAWHEAQDKKWLKVGFLPFDIVVDWFNSLEISDKNVASTDLERALFSLMHLGRASFMDPTAVLWIASALEALFDTPSGNSFSTLCKRVSLLLNLDATEANELRRRLRSFYDIRNAFVHGGSRIQHPLADDQDKAVEEDIGELLRAANFASAVLVGSVQELVRRRWKGLVFSEQISSP